MKLTAHDPLARELTPPTITAGRLRVQLADGTAFDIEPGNKPGEIMFRGVHGPGGSWLGRLAIIPDVSNVIAIQIGVES